MVAMAELIMPHHQSNYPEFLKSFHRSHSTCVINNGVWHNGDCTFPYKNERNFSIGNFVGKDINNNLQISGQALVRCRQRFNW